MIFAPSTLLLIFLKAINIISITKIKPKQHPKTNNHKPKKKKKTSKRILTRRGFLSQLKARYTYNKKGKNRGFLSHYQKKKKNLKPNLRQKSEDLKIEDLGSGTAAE